MILSLYNSFIYLKTNIQIHRNLPSISFFNKKLHLKQQTKKSVNCKLLKRYNYFSWQHYQHHFIWWVISTTINLLQLPTASNHTREVIVKHTVIYIYIYFFSVKSFYFFLCCLQSLLTQSSQLDDFIRSLF